MRVPRNTINPTVDSSVLICWYAASHLLQFTLFILSLRVVSTGCMADMSSSSSGLNTFSTACIAAKKRQGDAGGLMVSCDNKSAVFWGPGLYTTLNLYGCNPNAHLLSPCHRETHGVFHTPTLWQVPIFLSESAIAHQSGLSWRSTQVCVLASGSWWLQVQLD